jgi:hypothetical protein
MTTGAEADGAITNNKYVSIGGGTSTQQLRINEIYIGGESPTTSTVCNMVFARDSVIMVTPAAGTQVVNKVLTDAISTAPATAPVAAGSAGTPPTRSASHLLHLTLNTYGGIARWQARYGEEITIYGTATTIGQSSLSGFTGSSTSALTSGHILLEVV